MDNTKEFTVVEWCADLPDTGMGGQASDNGEGTVDIEGVE